MGGAKAPPSFLGRMNVRFFVIALLEGIAFLLFLAGFVALLVVLP